MRYALTNLFIVFYLLFACFWDSSLRWVLGPFRLLMRTLFLQHSWQMFAPNPPRRHAILRVEILFSDETSENWGFPKVSEMGPFRALLLGRYEKQQEQTLIRHELQSALALYLFRRYGESRRDVREILMFRNEDAIAPLGISSNEPPTSTLLSRFRFPASRQQAGAIQDQAPARPSG